MSEPCGPLEMLQEAARRPLSAWVADLPAGSAVGVACTYAPLELLHAAGLVPLRLHVAGRPPSVADTWLPPFSCSVVRGILGAALEGQLDGLAGVVIPHTCDSMQELVGIWQALVPGQWLLTPVEPLAVESPRAPAYLRQELQALAGRLAERLGRPVSDEALRASLALYNRLRRAVREIDGLRDRLPAAAAWAALSAAWQMPPEAYVAAAEALIAELNATSPRPGQGPALVLAGSLLDEPLVPELIDSLEARVVADDLCNGTRGASVLAAETGDPWSALAERLLRREPCPCKHASGGYSARLAELARRCGARGVVQVLVKFCDPHAFEAVAAGQALAALGGRHLLLEVEATNAPEQLRTRLQAFLELLRAV